MLSEKIDAPDELLEYALQRWRPPGCGLAALVWFQSRLRLQELLAAAQLEGRLLRADLDAQQGKNDWLTRKLLEAERNENTARRAAREVRLQNQRPPC